MIKRVATSLSSATAILMPMEILTRGLLIKEGLTKSLITSFVFLLFFSCSKPNKPEGLILKVQFQPEKTYNISTIRGSETVITYSGERFAMQKLKSMKVQNPTISKVRTKTDTQLEIGKGTSGINPPVKLIYTKAMSLDGKNEIPEGTIVTGQLNEESQPDFKTVAYSTLTIDQRIKLLQSIKNTFEQIHFPDKQLKIGDTLSVSRPTSIAMGASEIEIIITTNCKLIGIENGEARFNLIQAFEMNPVRMDNSFKGTGKGTGEMIYDIGNQFISDYSINTELIMNKKLDYFEFDLKTTSNFRQNTKLSTK